MRARLTCLAVLVCGLGSTARAADLDLSKAAQIEAANKKAWEEIDRKHGGRSQAEMDTSERSQLAKERSDAEKKVLEDNGTDPKAYSRFMSQRSQSDLAEIKQQQDAIEKKAEADKQKATDGKNKPDDKPKDPGAIPVQRGFSDSNPVTLDDKGGANGEVQVEKGLPADAVQDQQQAQQGGAGAPGLTDSKSETRSESSGNKKSGGSGSGSKKH